MNLRRRHKGWGRRRHLGRWRQGRWRLWRRWLDLFDDLRFKRLLDDFDHFSGETAHQGIGNRDMHHYSDGKAGRPAIRTRVAFREVHSLAGADNLRSLGVLP